MPSSSHRYRDLVQENLPLGPPPEKRPEEELDSLLSSVAGEHADPGSPVPDHRPDPIRKLREQMLTELIPTFVELVEKYSLSGMSLQMDASNFLEGGREIAFEFGLDEYRSKLMGTVTTEAIAFHETRHSPDVQGELLSGPMLRLRSLSAQTFRDFICERLTALVRSAARGRR